MNTILMTAIPQTFSLMIGLLVLLIVVLTAYWFFMARNNPRARKVDDLPQHDAAHELQERYARGEISEEEYHRQVKDLEDQTKRPI